MLTFLDVLFSQDVPVPAIVKHFQEALHECEELLDTLAIPLTSPSNTWRGKFHQKHDSFLTDDGDKYSDTCEKELSISCERLDPSMISRVTRTRKPGYEVSSPDSSVLPECESYISTRARDKGDSAKPPSQDHDEFGPCFDNMMLLCHQEGKTTQRNVSAGTARSWKNYASVPHERSTDRVTTNTSIRQNRSIKGSRYFSADFNSASSLLFKGNTSTNCNKLKKNTLTRKDLCDNSTREVAQECGSRGVRGNIRCTLDTISERLSHGRENEMKLAVETVYSQFMSSNKCSLSNFQVHKKMVHVELVVGPPIHFSRVVDGLVLECSAMFEDVLERLPTDARELSITLVNSDVTPQSRYPGFKESAHVNETLRREDIATEMLVEKDLWLRRTIQILQVHNIVVLVSKGIVDESLVDYCVSSNIVLLQNVSSSKLQLLCHATGATLVSYFTQTRWLDTGKLASIKTMKLAWVHSQLKDAAKVSRYVIIKSRSTHQDPLQTVVLCGTCRDGVYDMEFKFWNCLDRLRNALSCGRALPGAGIPEIACIEHLQQSAGDNR